MGGAASWNNARVFTVGHSTRTLDELVAMLRAFDVSLVADIRTIPRSRHNPQFNGDALRSMLRSRRIRYVHISELGGLRRTSRSSPNTGWRNASFRGFADYMLTDEFAVGLAKLHVLVTKSRVALMCAEAVPWRCHRSLIADALTARGAEVEHITSIKHAAPHRMTEFALVEGTRVTYPGTGSPDGTLAVRAPFHLEATVRVLQRRATNLVDVWEQGRYLRVLATDDGLGLVEVTNPGSVDDPDVRFSVLRGTFSPATRATLARTLRKILGLDVDPRPLQALAERERGLRPTALALRGMRPPRFADLFEAFANVVPFQQVSLDAGVAVVRRMVERFGRSVEHAGARFHAFPTARAIADARVGALQECGLSLRKADTLHTLAGAIERGELSEEKLAGMSSGEAIRVLRELKGIGPWSAALVLLRGLGRLDVFPPGDVGVARGLSRVIHLASGRSLERMAERFGDHRGYLYFCSLGGSLLAKGLIHAAPPEDRAVDRHAAAPHVGRRGSREASPYGSGITKGGSNDVGKRAHEP
jgi:3-methyladenine DNA glycosylase/8-oxoguanine DNA glycosylase